MPPLKYSLVIVALASWFVAAVFFVNGSLLRYAILFVATAYLLAVQFLALSALARKKWSEELSFGFEKKFLLSGPPGLAAIFSVAIIIHEMKYRNLCSVFDDCLSIEAFRHHIPSFLVGLTRISLQFYAIIGVATLFIRLIQALETNFSRRDR